MDTQNSMSQVSKLELMKICLLTCVMTRHISNSKGDILFINTISITLLVHGFLDP